MNHRSSCMSGRLVLPQVLAVACLVSIVSVAALAADPDPQAARIEHRIAAMHARLGITPQEETLWQPVADVMRADARSLDALTEARHNQPYDAGALADLKSYSEISDAHAAGVHRLTEAFTPLYASFTDGQKQEADLMFRSGEQAKRAAHPNRNTKGTGS